MKHPLNSDAFLKGWRGLIEFAIDHHLLDDAAAVIGGARVLRPRMVELALHEGRLSAVRGEYLEAIQLLREAEESPDCWRDAKALIASCKVVLEDGQWEGTVEELLADDDASSAAVRFARRLRDAEPVLPQEPRDPPAPAAPSIATPPVMDHGYGVFIRA